VYNPINQFPDIHHEVTKAMNRLGIYCAASLLAIFSSSTLLADAEPLSKEESASIDIVATVTSIDPETRVIAFTDAQGKVRTLTADPRVKRFSELEVGDQVSATIEISALAEVRAPTAEELANPEKVKRGVVRADANGPMAGSMVESTTAVVTVVGLNLLTETITLLTADDDLVDVRAESESNLKQLRLGDTIVVTYTESIVVSVDQKVADQGE
jgi:hypothetical protein